MDAVADGAIEQLTAAAEQRLRAFCSISSQSGNTTGLRQMAAALTLELQDRGLNVDVIDEPDANGVLQPLLIARGPATGDGHLLLLGHLDTVLPAIEPAVEGRRLLATGALDMKGGLAMFVGALDLLAARGEKFPDDLLLVLVPDEESESFISGNAAARWSEKARVVLVLEPGQSTPGGETLVAGRRGLTEWRMEVSGRPAHSGLAYWNGRSALAAAADWAARATKLSRRGEGPTVNVSRMVAGTTDFVQELGTHHDMLGSSRQLNVVSDRAVVEGEIRFLTTADGPAILAEMKSMADAIAAEYEVTATFTIGMVVSPVDPNGPGAALIQKTVDLAAARGFHLEVEHDRGGISFPNFIADPARTPVIDGLGPVGEGMHIRGEYLDLDSLGRRIVLLADVLTMLRNDS